MQRSYHFPLAERTRLSPVECDRLLAMARARPFADGQFVQQQGTPGDSFWAVVEGHVLVGRYAEDGGFTAFAVLGPGDLFGELAFFTGMPRQVDALANGPARLVAIDRALLRRLMSADVGWAELLLRSLGRQLAGTLDIIDAERRLGSADRLERLLRRFGLPTAVPAGLAPEALLARMRLDKKAQASGLRFILWDRPGAARVVADVPEEDVLGVLRKA